MAEKVALVIASEGYHQFEYGIPKKLLEQAGYKVITVSNQKGVAIAKDSSTTKIDQTIDSINPKDFAGIFFVGGPGAMDNLDNEKSYELLRTVKAAKIPHGAICISTRILAHAGILDGIEATGWDGDGKLAEIYREHHVPYAKTAVAVCNLTITAVGPSVAKEFGEAIVDLLEDEKEGK